MRKEIFTTDNMNELVAPIEAAMRAGNPVAGLVFKLNDSIRALKPGRPISKQERDNLEFLLDNIIVGLANDTMGIALKVAEEANSRKEEFPKYSFESVLESWCNAKNELDKKAEKVNDVKPESAKDEIGGSSESDEFDLEEIREALKDLVREDAHKQLDDFINLITAEKAERGCTACKETCKCDKDEIKEKQEDINDCIRQRKESNNKTRRIIIHTGDSCNELDEFDSVAEAIFKRLMRF